MSTLATIERIVGPLESVRAWDRDIPLASPESEEQLVEALRCAASERLAVLPLGLGSKLAWRSCPVRVDCAFSTRKLADLVAYEPADGTITARAGMRWSDLVNITRSGGHHLSPDVPFPESSTVGGVIAAGQSGFDRLRYGPVRHQVLGTRIALADGTLAKSGGRLVKNVTGYDMHRVHTGSFGTIGIILEVSLRLHPLPEARAVLTKRVRDRDEALATCRSLLALSVRQVAVVADLLDSNGWQVAVVLHGRTEVVRDAREQLTRAVAGLEVSSSAEGAPLASVESAERALRDLERARGAWPTRHIGLLPSRLRATLASASASRVRVHPGIASVSLWRDNVPIEPRQQVGAEDERLLRAFDPQGLFARSAP